MKKLFACFVVAAVLCAFALPNLYAVDAPDGVAMNKTKQPVTFNHSTHKDTACEKCHHTNAGDFSKVQKCSDAGCHDSFDQKDKSEKSYYKITHDRKAGAHPTCMSCHVEIAGADAEKKKQLTGCKASACHP